MLVDPYDIPWPHKTKFELHLHDMFINEKE